MTDLLQYIDQIDQSVGDAEINVLESMIQSYDKSIMIITEASDDTDLSAFDIFQEGETWDKFKEDTKAPVLGNKDESVGKRILMIIPRLIQKLIMIVRKLVAQFKARRLLKRIKSIEYTLTEDKKWKAIVNMHRTIDEDTIKTVLRNMSNPDFKSVAEKKGKLIIHHEYSIISEAKTHNPIIDFGKILTNNTGSENLSNETSDSIRTKLNQYDSDKAIELTYYMLNKNQIHSKFKYRQFIDFLKKYSDVMNEINKELTYDISDKKCEKWMRTLQSTTAEHRHDSGHYNDKSFGSKKSRYTDKEYYSLSEYKEMLYTIEQLTSGLSEQSFYKKLLAMKENNHPAGKWYMLMEEIKSTIEFASKYILSFKEDYDEMNSYMMIVQSFITELKNIYAERGIE